MFTNYTIVIGVDKAHLTQLAYSWETWQANKPSLMQQPFVIFYDRSEVTAHEIQSTLKAKASMKITYVPWPQAGNTEFAGNNSSKWSNPQRYKMLSGFVHVPAITVSTPYWLKIDTDMVATGDDDWIDESWFKFQPAIISPPWGYTKPANQMLKLDDWVDQYGSGADSPLQLLAQNKPLNLRPEEGANKVKHKRIISYVSFYNTAFTRVISQMAERTCGPDQLPVPSQDGYVWYCAARIGCQIRTFSAKKRGWVWTNGINAVRAQSARALS